MRTYAVWADPILQDCWWNSAIEVSHAPFDRSTFPDVWRCRIKQSSRSYRRLCRRRPLISTFGSRVHRFGQEREVTVVRFIIKDSVENRVLALQRKKRAIINGALGGTDKQKSKQTLDDLEVSVLLSKVLSPEAEALYHHNRPSLLTELHAGGAINRIACDVCEVRAPNFSAAPPR